MSFLDVAKRIVSYRQGVTGIAALVLFLLFASTVVWLHGIVEVDSPILGLSAWPGKSATEDRVKQTLDAAIRQESLATQLAGDSEVVRRIGAKDVNYVNAWKGLAVIAEALTTDSAKQLFTTLWEEPLAAATGEIRSQARTGLASIAPDRIEKLTAVYKNALDSVIDRWLSIELSPLRIESLLADGFAKAVPVHVDGSTAKKTGRGAPANAKAIATESPLTALTASIHSSSKSFLSARLETELRAAISRDLDPLSAQASIASAVHKDFAARWMWVISAALFLTFGVSAIVGAVPRLLSLVEKKHQLNLVASLIAAMFVAVFVGERFLADIGPAFLTRPIRDLETILGLGLGGPVTFLNVIAAAAIAVLLVTAWTSFLVPTRDDDHLDVQLGTLRWVLHTATLVLVAGVFETYALAHWPTALMADPAATMVESGAQTASIAIGVALSTLLLLIYVPGAIALVEEARRLQSERDDAGRAKIEALITKHGFDTSTTKQVVTFAQLLLPLLITAPLSQVVQLLGS